MSLKNKLGFVSTVVITMGLTVGALLCVLTLAYFLLLKPLPYPEQESLFKVEHAISDKTNETNAKAFTYPGLIHLYKKQTIFSETALVYYGADVLTSLSNQPSMALGFVTPEWFSLLKPSMLLGRTFEQTEALDTNNPVVVLSHETWQNNFNSDKDILNKKVDFSGISYRVIGVMDKSFIEPQIRRTGLKTRMWLPWDYNSGTRLKDRWGNIDGSLVFVGKLKKGISVSQAEQIITPLVNETWKEKVASIEFFNGWKVEMELVSFKSAIMGESANTVFLLISGVLGLVLIACANILNLFMSRTAEQQRPLSIRAALGATKKDLFQTLFAEAGILMLLSILIALMVSAFGFHILQQYLAEVLPRVNELGLNFVTLVLAVICIFGFAFIFAKLSSRMINYKALNSTLQSSGKGTGIQVSKSIRQILIISQVTVAMALIFININIFNDSIETINEPMGFTVENMVSTNLSYSAQKWPSQEERIPLMSKIREKLTQLPQVESVIQSTSPLAGFGLWALTEIASNQHYTPNNKSVSDGYFQMLGQPLLEGDFFSESDIKDNNDVMIVNEVFAERLAPDGNVLGMQISPGNDRKLTIIGVVKGIKIPGSSEIPMRVYVPNTLATNSMIIKLKNNQSLNREQFARIVSEVDKNISVYGFEFLTAQRNQLLFSQITTAITTVTLAVLSFFLAGIGLYGVLSYGTQMRRFEIGTRLAIGAKRKNVIAMVIKDNSRPIILGVGTSIIMLVVLYAFFSQELSTYIKPQLISMFAVSLLLIGSISFAACYLPLLKYINRPAIHSLRGSD